MRKGVLPRESAPQPATKSETGDVTVPCRPDFDSRFRGFHRHQVIEHIRLLEDQLSRVYSDLRDRREAPDDHRGAEQTLGPIEVSGRGLTEAAEFTPNPAAKESHALRQWAEQEAEIIRARAEAEAAELIREAEEFAGELRSECAELVAEMESRRVQLRREYATRASDVREREHRLRRSIRREYKTIVARAQSEADEVFGRTRRQCEQRDSETEQHRLNVLEESTRRSAELVASRQRALSAVDGLLDGIVSCSATLRAQTLPTTEANVDRLETPLPTHRGAGTLFARRADQRETGQSAASEMTDRTETNDADHQSGDCR